MKKTQLLQNFLSQQEINLSPEEFSSLNVEVDELIKKYLAILELIPAGITRAQKVHEFIDDQNNAFSHVKTSCAKGCGYCCHLEVEMTEDDAERLAEEVARLKIPLDQERLLNQSKRERLDPAWKKGFAPENKCVMLDENNSCRAYNARPTNCRRHSVVSPVSDCYTAGANPVSRIIPMVEIFMSAYISIPNLKFGSLSKFLISALQKIEGVDQIRELDFIEPKAEEKSETANLAPLVSLE